MEDYTLFTILMKPSIGHLQVRATIVAPKLINFYEIILLQSHIVICILEGWY